MLLILIEDGCGTVPYFLVNMCENAGGLPGRPSIPTAHY